MGLSRYLNNPETIILGPAAAITDAAVKAGGDLFEEATDVPVTPMPEEQKELSEAQIQGIQDYKEYLGDLYPVLLNELGYRETEEGLVPRTDEERIARMTPLERAQYENALQQ